MTALLTKGGYAATITDGKMTVHRVPIFVECERGENDFDAAWINAAVAKAKQAESEGYLPPLHVRHHEAATEANDSVRASGFFRILGTERITFKGKLRVAIMADLIVTDPQTQSDIMAMRLPYRSVEIFNVDSPAIDGLALLDHEAPFLELPMLMVGRVNRDEGNSAAGATNPTAWSMRGGDEGSTLSASFRRGRRAYLLFREETMADEPNKPDEVKDAAKFGDKSGEQVDSEASTPAVEAIVASIRDGSITVADIKALLAAIQEQQTASDPDAKAEPDDARPAPAATPGAESMSKETDDKPAVEMKAAPVPEMAEKMAALQGQNEGLLARIAAIESEAKRKDAVAAAMKRLEGRPLGADLEQKLVNFHREHGEAAFGTFVDSMAQAVGLLPTDDSRSAAFAGQDRKVSAAVMKYQAEGTDAIDRAAKFSREWGELHRAGLTRMAEDRYVAVNMAKSLAAK